MDGCTRIELTLQPKWEAIVTNMGNDNPPLAILAIPAVREVIRLTRVEIEPSWFFTSETVDHQLLPLGHKRHLHLIM